MEKFEELQSIWTQQSDLKPTQNSNEIITLAKEKLKIVIVKHFWTIGILTLLTLILILYYFWISAYKLSSFRLGLGLMILVIIIRIILEIISINKFRNMNFDNDFKSHSLQLHQFYKFRKLIHFVFTPIIYLIYILGFIIVLPQFKYNFSNGMYLYILVSGFGFLFFFSFYMIKEIKKDIANLSFLKNIAESF